MAKPRPRVGRVWMSHHQNTPQFTATKCDWSLELEGKKQISAVNTKTMSFSFGKGTARQNSFFVKTDFVVLLLEMVLTFSYMTHNISYKTSF